MTTSPESLGTVAAVSTKETRGGAVARKTPTRAQDANTVGQWQTADARDRDTCQIAADVWQGQWSTAPLDSFTRPYLIAQCVASTTVALGISDLTEQHLVLNGVLEALEVANAIRRI